MTFMFSLIPDKEQITTGHTQEQQDSCPDSKYKNKIHVMSFTFCSDESKRFSAIEFWDNF